MATSTAQRTGIWIIAVVLIVGTFAGFIAMILAPQNEAANTAQQQKDYERMLKEYQEEQQKLNKPLDGYAAETFNADDVKELKVEVVKEGTGELLVKGNKINANYFGWTSDGKIFDSTNKGGTLTPAEFPIIRSEESADGQGVIGGWVDGLTGQKVGSTVKLTIPGELAYGMTDNGSGRPVGPLMFIVEIKEVVKDDE